MTGKTIVLMFPGQTTRDPLMLERALAAWPDGGKIVAEASEVLGRDIRASLLGPDPFGSGRDIQVAVFLTSHVHLAALRALGARTPYSVGLSLGEYNHLVHIEAIGFADALRLVDVRGRLYDRSPRGKMVAVLNVTEGELVACLSRYAEKGTVAISNFNGPGQHVVAGEADLVDLMVDELMEDSFAVCHTVDDRLAMHTNLFDSTAEAFSGVLAASPWRSPRWPYRPGTDPGTLVTGAEEIPALLTRHVNHPVRFGRCLERVLAEAQDPVLVEAGAGNSLSNSVGRFRAEPVVSTDDPTGASPVFARIAEWVSP